MNTGSGGERSGAEHPATGATFVGQVGGFERLALEQAAWARLYHLSCVGDRCRHRRHPDRCEHCFQALTPRGAFALASGSVDAAIRLEVASQLATGATTFASISGIPRNIVDLLAQVDRTWRSLWLWDLYLSVCNHGYGLLYGDEPWPDSDLDALALELVIEAAGNWLRRVDELGDVTFARLPVAGSRDSDMERLRVMLDGFRGVTVRAGQRPPVAVLSSMTDSWA